MSMPTGTPIRYPVGMNLPRLIRTVAHLRPSQILWRARYTAERALGMRRVPPVPTASPEFNAAALARLGALLNRWRALDTHAPARALDFRAGRFVFLNDPADFSASIDWSSPGRPRLWRYQLHYFDCAKELAIVGDKDDAHRIAAWQLYWIANNPPVTDVAWDAFTISARLFNWALAAAAWGAPAPSVATSYLHQAHFLATHLERDIAGNHLLKNACALAVAGALVDPKLLSGALALLREQLAEQILPDGGHYERSPMYHALILEDLLLTEAVLGPEGEFLRPTIKKMAHFLAGILHPDGEIPFFGDSVLGEARAPAVLLDLAGHAPCGAPKSAAYPDSGFYKLAASGGEAFLILRGGMPGPPHQLGHAHADLFSIELSLGTRRVLVNGGTHGYAESPHRAWCRAEAAQNTIDVPRDPQLEAWGAFRVGARHQSPTVSFSPTDGFQGTAVLPHGTTIRRTVRPVEREFHIEDEAVGERAPATIARLQLAPGLTWQGTGTTWEVLDAQAEGQGTHLCLHLDAGQATLQTSPHFPAFGVQQTSQVLHLQAQGPLRYRLQLL